MSLQGNRKLTKLTEMFNENTDGKPGFPHESSIDKLIPFKNHPFKLYEGARLEDMVRSIKEYGVLVPLLVRRQGDKEEILSGHNRWNAAKIAGKKEVPTIVLEGLSDDEAMLIVTETNLIQRSFSDLLLSERACVLAAHYEALKCQGKRADLIKEIKELLNADNIVPDETSGTVIQKLDSREKVAEKYDMTGRTVARYIRLNNLSDRLKEFLDNGVIRIRTGEQISFLSTTNQSYLVGFLNSDKKIDFEKAKKLHELEKSSKLNEVTMEKVLDGTYKPKKKKSVLKGIKVNSSVMKKYFNEEQSEKDVQDIIDKALELYFSKENSKQ